MRIISFIIVLFLSTICLGQNNSLIKQVDSIVKDLDKHSRVVEKFKAPPLGYIEYGITDNNTISKIIYSYKAGPRQIIETFYLQDTSLLFVKKQVTSYYLYGDSIVLLGEYYFEKRNLKYYTVYHDEKEKGITQTQAFILSQYKEIRSIISRHQK